MIEEVDAGPHFALGRAFGLTCGHGTIRRGGRCIPRVKQHQIVYAALRGRMGGELHALALQTSAPE